MTGATLHTVSRLLTTWEERGWCGAGEVAIADRVGLQALADGAMQDA